MNSTEFKTIEQFDMIEFQWDEDPEPHIAAVGKDGSREFDMNGIIRIEGVEI